MELLRVAWRTVGSIVTRVNADIDAGTTSTGFRACVRIGIDEISYKRGHRYLIRGRLTTTAATWCGPAQTATTTHSTFLR